MVKSDKVFDRDPFLIEAREYLKFQDNGRRRIRHGAEEHCKVSLQQACPLYYGWWKSIVLPHVYDTFITKTTVGREPRTPLLLPLPPPIVLR